jgi:hypothetical protein
MPTGPGSQKFAVVHLLRGMRETSVALPSGRATESSWSELDQPCVVLCSGSIL